MSRALADRYVLGEPLGSGGSSRVHVAVDKRLDRRVAVKLLDSNVAATADPAARERFLREGRTTAAFNHRHAVTVFDAGEDDGDLYLVMELVDGPSLAELMARSGPLPIEQAVRIAAKVLSALAAAHAVGIVHRDVKPANILLGPNGAVKLADFGIAKRFDDLSASVTSTGMVVGTPRYLSPEQARGEAATPASDVYSMGVVLFEMLTGRQPFEGDAAIAIAVAQQAGPAPDVRSLRPEVPVALASVVAHALAAQPSARPATAAEMLTALTTARTTTMAVPSAPAAGAHRTTQAMPAAAVSRTIAAPASEPSTGRRAIMLFAAFIGVLGVVVAAAALTARDDDPTTDATSVTSAPAPLDAPGTSVSETSAATAPPTTTADASATAPATTEPPPTTTTEPATTTTQTTQPPETTAPVAEIIPGFPETEELAVFLAQLERDPELVGPAGEELAERLERVVDERGNTRKEADELRRSLDKWVEDDQLAPPIAEALDDLLRPLSRRDED